MSGPAPETEREQQLRALANRLLSWPDPDGPSTVELMPLGYPEDLPPELVDYADLRFLGSLCDGARANCSASSCSSRWLATPTICSSDTS